MIKYYKLFDMLNRKDMNKSDLLDIISSKTIAKLSKGANLNTDVIDKICEHLKCQPGDIMEYVVNATDMISGEKVELANHTLAWEHNDPRKPEDTDFNAYYEKDRKIIEEEYGDESE